MAEREGPSAARPETIGDTGESLRRAIQEFLGVPILMVIGAIGLAGATYLVDAVEPGFVHAMRRFMAEHVFGDAASTSTLLAAIATSVVTVTSITFSLLLIAVQQAASTLSTQVFDQFMQRRANQLFFGYFLGVGLFALLTLATVTPDHNPVIGGSLALGLTGIALILIPAVIYSTLDQMRPPEIVAAIRTHGLAARQRQLPFLARTRRSPMAGGPGAPIETTRTGFVTRIDLDALDAALHALGPEAEVEIAARIGTFVAFGNRLALVRDARSLTSDDRAAFEGAFQIERERELRSDPEQALAQLEAIGWTTTSSSKQNPHGGFLAVYAISDLVARWARAATESSSAHPEPPNAEGPAVAVVYRDDLLDRAVRTLGSMIVVASEGMQHQVAAAAYTAFARSYGDLPGAARATAGRCITRSMNGLADHVPTQELEESLRELIASVRLAGDESVAASVERAIDALVAGDGRLSSRGNRPA